MSLIELHRGRFARRNAFAALGLGAAASLSVATMLNPRLAHDIGERVNEGIGSMKTVAAMLAERSPGLRPEGALANLKPKRQAAVLHERALPKIPGPVSPVYNALAAPTPIPPIAPPVTTPLFTALAGAPPVAVVPMGVTPGSPGGPGGPPILSDIPPPGGGGGGILSLPVVAATPQVPATPVESVPEPATWAMMMLGFALMGRGLRRWTAANHSPTPK